MDKRLIWFEKLYDTHADAVWRHLYYQLGDAERANELLQEVFLKTWQYVLQDKHIEHEKAFLYRVARNLFINDIRSKKQAQSLDQLTDAGFEVVDATDTTAVASEHRELRDRLALIKDSYRTVLTLRYIDDLPVKEIAKLLGEQETNISMRIKRGIEALKQTYETHP